MSRFDVPALRAWMLIVAGICFAPGSLAAVAHDVQILMDLDNDVATGCAVATVGGPFDGVEQILVTTVDTTSPPPAGTVTDVAIRDCVNPATDTFGPPASFDGGWPIGIDNGEAGLDVVETYFPLLSSVVADPKIIRVAVVVTDEFGGEQVLLTEDGTPGGPPILVSLQALLEIPTLGEWGLILLALLLAGASIALLGRRGAVAAAVALLLVGSGLAWAAPGLDGLINDWFLQDRVASNGMVLWAKEFNDQLCFRVDVELLFNTAPTADPQAVATPANTSVGITLTGSDPEGDPLTFTIVPGSGPDHGTLTGAPPNVTYDPDPDYEGPDSFDFQVEDPSATTDTATVSITVNAVNDAPVVDPAAFAVAEDATVGTSVGTATFTDPDAGQTHTFAITAGNTGGAFAIDAGTGVITVAAALDFETLNSYSLTVEVTDDGSPVLSGSNTVTVDVTDVDDAPVAVDDAATVTEDDPATAIDVLANDTDADGGTKFIAAASDPANGTVVLTGGTPGAHTGLTYQPDANYCNNPPGTSPDTFTYTLTPGGDVGLVSVTVDCVNDAPDGTDKTVTTAEDTDYTFAAADFGFTDPNDTPANAFLAVVITTLPAAGTLKLSNVAVTAGQSIAAGAISNLTFTPAPGANGTPYTSFTFQVQDDGGTANGGVDLDPTPNTMTINVNDINDAPAGTDTTVATNEDVPYTFAAADFGFTDPDDTPPDAFSAVTITTLPGAGSLELSSVPVTAGQSIPVGSIPNLVFTPASNANGTPYTTFTFQVQDDGGTANGGVDLDPTPNTLTINVNPVNDPPAGTDNTVTGDEDVLFTFTALHFGFTDPLDTPANNFASVRITTLPTAGSLTLSGSGFAAGTDIAIADINAGNLKFLGALNEFGTPYATFNFQVRDDGGTLNGGVDLDPTPNLMTINLNPVNDPPLAAADSWQTIGNTQLVVDLAALATPHVLDTTGSGLGVRDNDSDPEGDSHSVTAIVGCADVTAPFTCPTVNGGTVVMNADGTFTYTPAPGDTLASDSFQYTLTDDGVPSPASANGTVTINRLERVWYVDPTAPGGGNGTSGSPLDSLTPLDASDGVGDSDSPMDYIFIHEGTLALGSPFDMEANQHLIGEGVGLSIPVDLNGNGSPTDLVPAGTAPELTNATGDAINATEAVPVEIVGLSLQGSSNAIDLTTDAALTGSSTLTIANNEFRGASTEGIDVNLNASTTGTLNLNITNNTWDLAGTHTGNAVDVDTNAGTLRLNISSNTNVLSAASAIVVDGTGGGTTTITGFSGNSVHQNTGGSGIVVNTATFDSNPTTAGFQQVAGGTTVVGTSGAGVGGSGVDMTSVSGDLAFTDLDVFADNGRGLRVGGTGAFNSGGTGTRFTVGAGVGIIEATGNAAVDLSNLTADLQLSSLKSTNTTGMGVSLASVSDAVSPAFNAVFSAGSGSSIVASSGAGPAFNVSGGNAQITYGGTITNNGTGRAVSITTWAGDDSGDDLLLSGAIDENGAGILVNGNGGTRPITFSGGMDIDTTNGEGFAATSNTNTGGLNITGTNTIDSVSATGLRVTSTTIGSSHLNFQRISSGNNTAAADPANGIVLDSTGPTGRLIVTGTGSAGSGGTIQNATGTGISLTSTQNPSFSWMQLNGFGDFAIRGSSVAGFTLANSVINGVNGNDAAADEGSVRFTELTGSVSISSTNISGGFEDNFAVVNTSGTLNRITFDNVTIGANSTSDGNDGIKLEAQGTAVLNATIQNSVFTSSRGDLFQMSVPGSGSGDLVFTGNTLSNNHPAIATGGGGVTLGSGSTSAMTMNIDGNSFRDAIGHAVLIVKDVGAGSLSGNFSNNTIGVAADANSGSLEGDGLKIQQAGQGTLTMSVTSNQVRQYNNQGIHLQAGAGIAHGGNFNVTVSGNTIANPGNNPNIGLIFQGLHLNNGVTPGDSFQTCVNIGANTITNSGRNGGTDFRLRARQSTTVRLPGYAGGTHDTAAVVTFVQGKLVTAASGSAAADAGSGGFIGTGTTCP